MLGEMTAVLSCTKAAVDLTKGMISLKKDADIQAKAIELNGVLFELQQQLMNAQLGQMQLIEMVADLKAEVARLKAGSDLSERYKLHRFELTGHHAYVLKPEYKGSEPEHYLCSKCYENGKRITLRGRKHMMCPECGTRTHAEPMQNFSISRG